MRILDENNVEVTDVDFEKGYYTEDTIVIAHHDAQEYISEVSHYRVIAEYPNGGKDVEKIIDIPGQEAKEAWDETEAILRWHAYTQEEIEARHNAHEAATVISLLKSRVNALSEQMDFYEECIVEMAEVIYA